MVIVLDFGAQYNQLIARRVRESQVYSEILPFDTPIEEIRRRRPQAVILSGGPASVYDPGAPRPDPALFDLGVPILGICYGMQLMAHMLGGLVERAERREYGPARLEVFSAEQIAAQRRDAATHHPDDTATRGAAVAAVDGETARLLAGLGPTTQVWMSHGDLVLKAPPGFLVLAGTANTPIAAMADPARRLYAVQFHPEVAHTPLGKLVFDNFLHDIARLGRDWTPASIVTTSVEAVQRQVGEGHAIVALSGGVDSAVAALIAHRAIGDRLHAIFVDHGFLREGEAEEVAAAFQDTGLSITVVDARKRFLDKLAGVRDPERKRRIVGREFIASFEEKAREIGRVDYLVQGTLYPDVIESGSRTASVIKTHHNVGGLPKRMRLRVVEPLRYLFKDEVRKVALELGLPPQIAWRQPFPGPGLAVRIIGAVTEEKLAVLRRADAIVREEIGRWMADQGWSPAGRDAGGLHRPPVAQYFAVLPDLRSVGVMGDNRTYGRTIVIRAVTTDDFMTADWTRLPADVLARMSARITNEVPGINRVVYDITPKPPGTVEWE